MSWAAARWAAEPGGQPAGVLPAGRPGGGNGALTSVPGRPSGPLPGRTALTLRKFSEENEKHIFFLRDMGWGWRLTNKNTQ